MEERNDFLLKDLGCKFTDVKGIFPDPSTLLLRISFVSTTVVELNPGHAQLATVGALSFINIHTPTEDTCQRENLFSSLQPHLAKPISPLLVGDFNSLQHPIDRSTGYLDIHQRSATLATILTAGNYVDSFRVLHPTATVFSFNRPGSASSRLGRIYIPPLLESRPRVARYLPSTSDHLAYLLRLETAGFAVLPSLASKRSAGLYWKFNSSLLSDPAFLPAFRAFWRPLTASRPLPPAGAASTASQPPSQPQPGTPQPSPVLQTSRYPIRIQFHPIRIPFHPIRIPFHTIRIRIYHYLFPSAIQQPSRTFHPLSHPTSPYPLPEPARTGLAARGGRHSTRWPPLSSLQHLHSIQSHKLYLHSQHHHSRNLRSLHLLSHHLLSLLSLRWSLGIPLQLPGGRKWTSRPSRDSAGVFQQLQQPTVSNYAASLPGPLNWL
jgi:hypothetical protein